MKSPCRWGFQINLDAIRVSSIEWLIVEAKHDYTKGMPDIFLEKAVAEQRLDQQWVWKSRVHPKTVIPLISSMLVLSLSHLPSACFVRMRLFACDEGRRGSRNTVRTVTASSVETGRDCSWGPNPTEADWQ